MEFQKDELNEILNIFQQESAEIISSMDEKLLSLQKEENYDEFLEQWEWEIINDEADPKDIGHAFLRSSSEIYPLINSTTSSISCILPVLSTNKHCFKVLTYPGSTIFKSENMKKTIQQLKGKYFMHKILKRF